MATKNITNISCNINNKTVLPNSLLYSKEYGSAVLDIDQMLESRQTIESYIIIFFLYVFLLIVVMPIVS